MAVGEVDPDRLSKGLETFGPDVSSRELLMVKIGMMSESLECRESFLTQRARESLIVC